MSGRARARRYGACIAVVLAGVACGALINGTAGGTAATVLVGIGLVGIVSLVFYEVGLTEDRDLARGIRSPYLPDEDVPEDGPPGSGDGPDDAPSGSTSGDRHDHVPEPTSGDGHHDASDGHGLARPRPLDRRRGQRRRLR